MTKLYNYLDGTKTTLNIIKKLENLTNLTTFFNDVKKLTKNIKSNKNIALWQCYSEMRYIELGGKL